jgi:hypothetical protein
MIYFQKSDYEENVTVNKKIENLYLSFVYYYLMPKICEKRMIKSCACVPFLRSYLTWWTGVKATLMRDVP